MKSLLIPVVGCAVVIVGCSAGAAGSDHSAVTVESEATCSAEPWGELSREYLRNSGAIWIGTVKVTGETARDEAQGRVFTRVDTTVASVPAGSVESTTVSGWVVGGASGSVVTPSDGSAWAADGRAVIFSYPADESAWSPRLEAVPIVGEDVILGLNPCLGARDLPAHQSGPVTVDTSDATGSTVRGDAVGLEAFSRVLSAAR